jgi:hypothetical protein
MQAQQSWSSQSAVVTCVSGYEQNARQRPAAGGQPQLGLADGLSTPNRTRVLAAGAPQT